MVSCCFQDKNDSYLAMSDFIAPIETNINDYIGLFVTSAGFGIDKCVKDYEK